MHKAKSYLTHHTCQEYFMPCKQHALQICVTVTIIIIIIRNIQEYNMRTVY